MYVIWFHIIYSVPVYSNDDDDDEEEEKEGKELGNR